MSAFEAITEVIKPHIDALAEAHGALGQALAEAFQERRLTLEQALMAVAVTSHFYADCGEQTEEVGLLLAAKVITNEAEAEAFRKELDDLPEAA